MTRDRPVKSEQNATPGIAQSSTAGLARRIARLLLPSTLLWQTFLLIGLLLILALAAWSQIFRHLRSRRARAIWRRWSRAS